jgi:hypothetical protein
VIAIGYVTNRPGAKPHLMVDGVANCPAVRGRRAIRDTYTLTADQAPLVCLRCRPAVLAEAQAQLTTAEGSSVVARVAPSRITRLAALVEALHTGRERAALAAARERFRADYDLTAGLALAA